VLTNPDELDEDAVAKPRRKSRRGFLPIVTNWFDRLFIAIYLGVALELFWLRFVEQAVPLTACHLLVLVLSVLIIWKG
jgi:predicted small integral membrane protein